MIFKRGKFYWFEFEFQGRRYRKTTNVLVGRGVPGDVSPKEKAKQVETAKRQRLALSAAGIQQRDPAAKSLRRVIYFRATLDHVPYDTIDSQHDVTMSALKTVRRFRLYDLRHTFLTRLGKAGADAFAIQKIAGHSTITISQRYVHPTEEKVEDAFSRLERYNAKKAEELELKRRANGEMHGEVPVPPESPTDDQGTADEADATLIKSIMSREGIEPSTY